MRRLSTSWPILIVLLLAAGAFAQDPADAANDTLASTPDGAPRTAEEYAAQLGISVEKAAAALAAQGVQASTPFITSWTFVPKLGYKAKMQKTGYDCGITTTLSLRDKSILTQTLTTTLDDYRSQEKTVETRSASVAYTTDAQRALTGSLNLTDNWSRDEITNSAGTTNVNRRETRLASATLKRDSLVLGGLAHDLAVKGNYNQQIAEQLGQKNDISEAALDGALRSEYRPREWLSMHSGLYAVTKSGERTLGSATNPSSSDGDSIRAGVFYERGVLSGGVSLTRSSYTERYLDWNRTSSGVVDTIGVDEKIVQELERDDATNLNWRNSLLLGGVQLVGEFKHVFTENSFRASRVGTRERLQDDLSLTVGFRPSRLDTVDINYTSRYKWDDQIYKGAISARGRQVSRSKDVAMNLTHDLFRRTKLRLNLRTGLSQEIAVGEFNVNDRDVLETGGTVKLDTQFDNGFVVKISCDARRTEDISIRSERSSNNSIKDTYEIAPSYTWPMAPWLDLNQSFRVWIQYSDYVYSDWESVSKIDNYNKRGNLNTQVMIRPNPRLTLTIRHDLNIKSNANKTRTDAAGAHYFDPVSDQTVSKIDYSMQYKVSDWLSLEGTTYRKKDYKEAYGSSTTVTERFSGEVAVGGRLKKTFGKDKNKSLTLAARRFFAEGPNVQEVNRAYWDADLEWKWSF